MSKLENSDVSLGCNCYCACKEWQCFIHMCSILPGFWFFNNEKNYSDFFVSYSSSIVPSFCLLQINLSALKIRIFMVFPKAKLPTFHVELTHTRKPTRFLGLSILLVVAWIYPVILLQTKGLPAFCITRPRVKWIMERCFV